MENENLENFSKNQNSELSNEKKEKRKKVAAKKEKDSSKSMPIPSVEEVAEYCHERQNNINAEEFCNFYQAKGWLIGKNKMKDWKAAVRTWEQKRIKNNGTTSINYQQPSSADKQQYTFDRHRAMQTLLGNSGGGLSKD